MFYIRIMALLGHSKKIPGPVCEELLPGLHWPRPECKQLADVTPVKCSGFILFYFILAWLRVLRSLPRNGKLQALHQKW